MERKGINGYVSGVESHDLFGENTQFRRLCSRFVRNIVESGSWFSFCTKIHKSQVDVFKVESDNGNTFGRMVNLVSPYNTAAYKVSLYKYMLSEFLCYMEYPIVIRQYQSSSTKNSFEKMLVTSNINVVAEWLGVSVEESDSKFGSRLLDVSIDNECSYFPYLKLYKTKDGEHKVTRPRKDLDIGISGLRIVPLFALKEGVDVLYGKLKEDSYTVSFVKDSGQEREINTTFNKSIAEGYYQDSLSFVNRGFSDVYGGSFISNPNLDRGYIRVFELGSSVYDSPTRSINYARVVKFEKQEPNMAYSHIDLDKVIDTFEYNVMRMSQNEVEEVVQLLEGMGVGSNRTIGNQSPIRTTIDLCSWAGIQETLLSTVFLRDLALFMIAFPDYFGGYTGEGNCRQQGSSFEDFELDMI